MEPTVDIDIRLAKISELPESSSFNRWEMFKYSGQPVDIDLHTQFIPYTSLGLLNLVLGVTYTTTRNYLRHTLLRYDIELSFEISNMDSVINISNHSVYVPPTLTNLMLSVGIGSLRGMLAVHTRHTFLSRYPLPIFDLRDMLGRLANNDATVNAENPLFSSAQQQQQ